MTLKSALTAAALTTALAASTAQADGVYKIYDTNQSLIGEVILQEDVYLPNEGTVAMLTMEAENLVFYVPQDAIYITLDHNNPVIAHRQVFEGGWLTTDPNAARNWGSCSQPATDHQNIQRPVWGNLEWITTDLINGFPEISIRIGQCDNGVGDWATTNVALDFPPVRVAQQPKPVDEAIAMDHCGNNSDTVERALSCSDVIANPFANASNVSWAHWSRAYLRCGNAPERDVIADLVASARVDTAQWQEYYARASDYTGPQDGQFSNDLYASIVHFVEKGCR